MGLKFANFGKAVVSSAPAGPSGLSFTVEAGKGLLFPVLGAGDYFYGIFKDASGNREVVKVEARSSDSMTIAAGGRGLDGTTARTWSAGDHFVAGLVSVALGETLSNANVAALGQLVSSADKIPYFTGAGAMALATLTPFIRSLLDDADAATARSTLGAAQAFPAGTSMLFYNASAPVGWTHDTTALNHTLRVVAGGGGGGGTSGGSVNFTDAFKLQGVSGSVNATTLSEAQMPAHRHQTEGSGDNTSGAAYTFWASNSGFPRTLPTTFTGGSGAHSHGFSGTAINLAVRYMNVIRATKT